jgi:pimeloyl-ACP methyl ester carboxylesterase
MLTQVFWTQVSYASNAGYPTLTIDRLGNGASEHPEPILHVQDPLHVEVIHNIIHLARTNQLPIPSPRAFNTILLAGHSLGSVISNVLNMKYPADAEATLLTGYAPILPINEIGILVQGWLFPAYIYEPARYGGYNPGYLEFTNRADFDFLFYLPGQFDHNLESLDYATRGTFALGEAATAALPSQVATEYTNPVLVITGSHDSFFCSPFSLDIQVLFGTPSCDTSSSGPAAETRTLYPNARVFDVLSPNAGHCWHLHYSALEFFAQAHQWLVRQGF